MQHAKKQKSNKLARAILLEPPMELTVCAGDSAPSKSVTQLNSLHGRVGHFEFVTDWHINAPLTLVWNAILRTDRWPTWWRGVDSVTQVRKGRPDGLGFIYHYAMRGALPYRLHFNMESVAIEPLRSMEGRASGEVEGFGRWNFITEGAGTKVRYVWNIRLASTAMRLLSVVGRSAFAWNHDVMMRKGGIGLASYLQLHKVTRPVLEISMRR